MTDSQTKVRDVAWNELCPWLILVRSVRIALMARVLVLGAVGLIATAVGWRVILSLFAGSSDPVITEWPRTVDLSVWEDNQDFWVNTSAQSAQEVFFSAIDYLPVAPIEIWTYLTRPFTDLFRGDLTSVGFLFLVVCGIWELIVWGLIGGAITRIAALRFTRDEAPGFVAALRHAAGKWPSYSLPPLIALAGAALFAIQLVVLGFLMRIDVIAFLAAIAWPFVILLGLMMAILLLGALVGWPLMWATVSVEGTDAFDALSRSYAYTYHRPWRLLWYIVFATILAIVSMFVVKLFATSAIKLGNWSIDWGLDERMMQRVVSPETARPLPPPVVPPLNGATTNALPPADPDIGVAASQPSETAAVATTESAAPPVTSPELGRVESATRRAIHFWKSVVAALAAGYQAGFLWVAAVGIYLLLRRDIDGVQMNEVYIDPSDEYGMPLAEDISTGVPDVPPVQPAPPGEVGLDT
jgi:hypothetical protein